MADQTEQEQIAALKKDQQDWRNGVALIASSLGDPGHDLSCARLAELALTCRAELEERDAQIARLTEQVADLEMHKASRDSQLACLLREIGGYEYPTMNDARDKVAEWKKLETELAQLRPSTPRPRSASVVTGFTLAPEPKGAAR